MAAQHGHRGLNKEEIMELDIQAILQKARARLGELEMQLIIAEATIEHLQAQIAKDEGVSKPKAKE